MQILTKIKLPSYYIKNEGSFLMDYEIMMNGNVKIGTYAPDAERLYKGGVIQILYQFQKIIK